MGSRIRSRGDAVALNHGFEHIGLNTIWLVVRADNARAIRLYERLGFRHDGRLRAAALVAGRYYDKLLMSVLASEWADQQAAP